MVGGVVGGGGGEGWGLAGSPAVGEVLSHHEASANLLKGAWDLVSGDINKVSVTYSGLRFRVQGLGYLQPPQFRYLQPQVRYC